MNGNVDVPSSTSARPQALLGRISSTPPNSNIMEDVRKPRKPYSARWMNVRWDISICISYTGLGEDHRQGEKHGRQLSTRKKREK